MSKNENNHLSNGAKIMRQEIIAHLDRTAPAVEQVLADMVSDNQTAPTSARTTPVATPKKYI